MIQTNDGWEFDVGAWGRAIRTAHNFMGQELAGAIGVNDEIIRYWRTFRDGGHQLQWPAMRNFTRICSVLHMNPKDFFITKDAL